MADQLSNMRHMEFIDAVAAEDLRELRRKEATYQGSWKKEGGRSAWANVKRKIDRLVQMMARPPEPDVGFNLQNIDDTIDAISEAQYHGGNLIVRFPGIQSATVSGGQYNPSGLILKYLRDCYVAGNIFAGIRQDPTGADGSPLAEVRDLRRYLLLIEAEMMARGVVAERVVVSYRPGTPEDGGHHEVRFKSVVRDGDPVVAGASPPDWPYIVTQWRGNEFYVVDRRVVETSVAPLIHQLQRECSDYEWNLLPPEHRGLYDWHAGPSKWIIRPGFEAWVKD